MRNLKWCRYEYFVGWESEGRYQSSKMFCWEPERRYCCTNSMVIAPFWFSTEHLWIVIAPFWLSTDNFWTLKRSRLKCIFIPLGESVKNTWLALSYMFDISTKRPHMYHVSVCTLTIKRNIASSQRHSITNIHRIRIYHFWMLDQI